MKKAKKIFAAMLTLALVIGLIPTQAEAAGKKAVKSVTITNVSASALVLKPKQTFKLKTKVKVTGKAGKKVSYKSSNKKAVTVSRTGKIKAVRKGTAKITVRSTFNKKKKTTLKVIVGTPVKKVKLNKTSVKGYVGGSVNLKAAVSPRKASVGKVTWKSSNTSAATVSKKGKVTFRAPGTAKITATAADGSKKKAVCKVTVIKRPEEDTKPEQDLSYDGYELKWEDEFEGTELNRNDWNVELHDPGWVNDEWQSYVDSTENIYVKDGSLVIRPIKKTDENGEAVYTSGRINTQKKHDFKYGLFEARVKVPEGMGYLPAFWMMPTDENRYGQWPKCGEIDIMEVMGQTTSKVHGTIHYGEPHRQSQGTYDLTNGSFADEFHTFSCEWEPGSIKWYVDGILYHEENDWYSTKPGQGTVTYPAPFDQPFYMILNLAVGGSWVGYPDETTDFENQAFVVDYVKAWQKDSYDENVKRPDKEITLRDPDENGNYVNNADFAVAEDLADGENWEFMTANGGEATATIADNTMTIKTTKAGDVDYSVQLVQAGIPFEKGATYRVEYAAKADDARTMKTDVKAPDYNYTSYMNTLTAQLTTEYQTFSQEFKMTGDSDANGRLEFNMGAAGSCATIYIQNVSVKKIKDADPNEEEEKTVLADGNYVYNGSFQEGEGRLGYWEITNGADASVYVENGEQRRLTVEVNDEGAADRVIVGQSGLALTDGTAYALSFDACADTAKDMTVTVGGQSFTASLTEEEQSYQFRIPAGTELTDYAIAFQMGTKGTIWLDNVRLVEDTLIKNGSFEAGTVGWDIFVDGSASASYVVDSINEDNALDLTVMDTGDAEWKIQLKQENVRLEKGKYYKLAFDIKSSIARDIQYSIQRNGNIHDNDWTPYVQETVNLAAYGSDGEYKHVEKVFQMTEETDDASVFNIAMGALDNKQITDQHRICIDNIQLEETENIQ